MRTAPLLILLAGVAGAAESILPEPAPTARYDQTLAQSPFALATKIEAPAAPQESFASNWVLTGLSQLPDDQGAMQDFVTIRSRDQRIAFSLFGPEESTDAEAQGVSIDKVTRLPETRKSFVTLKKGTETAKVEFGQEAAVAPAAQGGPGPASPGRPGFPPVGGNVPAKIVAPGAVRPAVNAIRPGLPRPVAGPQAVGGPGMGGPGAQPGGVSSANADHRRVRVIQSQP